MRPTPSKPARPPRKSPLIKEPATVAEWPDLSKDFQDLVRFLHLGIVLQDADGKIIFANPAAEQLLGLTFDQMLGRTSSDPRWRAIREDGTDFPGESHPAMIALQTGRPVSEVVMGIYHPVRDEIVWIQVNAFPRFRPGEDKPFRVFTVISDITPRKRAEERIDRLAELLEFVPGSITVHDFDGRFIYVNRKSFEMHGYTREEFSSLNLRDIDVPASASLIETRMNTLREKGEADFEVEHIRKDGTVFPLAVSARLTSWGNRPVILSVAMDISERARVEEIIRAEEEKFRMMADQLVDVLYITDAEGVITYLSPSTRAVFDREPEEMVGRTFAEFLSEEDIGSALEGFRAAIRSGAASQNLGLTMKRKGGDRFFGEINGSVLFSERRPVGTIGLIRDVTRRRKEAEALRAALQEKDVLLREIHHRVKNNMQIVCSLLNLQNERVEEPAIREVLKDCQFRIRSMALVHESLYRSDSLARIDFAGYLRRMYTHLSQALNVSDRRIVGRFDVEEFFLDIGTAIPLGLIVSELVTNALKHAFPFGREGEIRIGFRREGENGGVLTIADNGIGLPPSFDFATSDSLGLQIVHLLADQIDAKIDLIRRPETRFVLTFKEAGYPERIRPLGD